MYKQRKRLEYFIPSFLSKLFQTQIKSISCRNSMESSHIAFLCFLLSTNLLTLLISYNFYSSFSSFTSSSGTINVDTKSIVLDNFAPEFSAFTSGKLLPFGFNPNFNSDTISPPVGQSCILFPKELNQYMSYEVNGSCPDDELLAQKLLLKGCEPLPCRRCRPATPPSSVDPLPLPASLWSTPSDTSVVWTAYTCKSFECLINRNKQKGFDDCKDCFDLNGREKNRWTAAKSNGIDFSIDDVLATKKSGTIRIGLDIGGGVATFAVRMRERNITIVTTSMNLNGPFNNFIASRGVVPMYISISQRLPFFDNTLDIVHSMHVMSNWIPTTLLHFMFFDIYRVLRPGGLFWLDHFFCVGDEMKEVYSPLIESVGFKKAMWVTGKKLDRGPERREMYLSALLEKPLANSS